MTDYTNNFNQASGTTVTTTNSAASGTAFQSASSNGATLKYSSTWKAYGTASLQVAGAVANATAYLGWSLGGSQTKVTTRFYLNYTAAPTTDIYIAVPVNSSTILGGIALNSSQQVKIKSPAGNIYTTSSTLSPNTTYRVEATFTIGTTATNGALLLKVFLGDSTTPLSSVSPTSIDTGTTPITAFRVGKTNDAGSAGTFYIDELAVRNSATLFGPSGVAVLAAPTVNLGANVTGTAASLTTVVTTYDNVAPTYAWAQTAGPTVTIANTAATSQSFTGLAAGTYSFRVTVTDDVGKTATDTETFTIAASTPPPSGSTVPNASALLYPDVFVISALGSTASNGGALTYTITPSAGLSVVAPGVWAGIVSTTGATYTVQVTEAGASGPDSVTVQVPAAVETTTNGTGVIIEVATDDAAAGGIFM